MNGRIYVPRLGQFLQTDTFGQALTISQSLLSETRKVWNTFGNSSDGPDVMINIILDTNTYRADIGRKSAPFMVLEELAKSELLCLHLPYYIDQEFKTQLQESAELLQSATKLIDKAVKLPISSELAGALSDLSQRISNVSAEVANELHQGFDAWKKVTGARSHALDQSHGHRVTDAYFGGRPPFTEPKVRKHIPDAFVFQQVADIAQAAEEVVFVCGDDNLRNSVSENLDIMVFGTLRDFVESKEVRDLLLQNAKDALLERNVDKVRNLLARQLAAILPKVVASFETEIVDEVFSDYGIPNKDGSASISQLTDHDSKYLSLDIDSLTYLGSGNYVAQFDTTAWAEFCFYIYSHDYWAEQFGALEYVSVTGNGTYLGGYSEAPIAVAGEVTFRLDMDAIDAEDSFDQQLPMLLEGADIAVSSFESISLCEPPNG